MEKKIPLFDGISIQQTIDGGYIVAGSSSTTNSSYYDACVVKLDDSGNIQWRKTVGGALEDYASDVQQTTDGGYIIAGGTSSSDGDVTVNHGSDDVWIVKLDTLGNMLWQKSFGGSGIDYANSIQQTADGGYIVGCDTYSTDGDITLNHGFVDGWIIKLNSNGILQWQKTLGGTCADEYSYIRQTIDGGYIVTSSSCSIDGDVTGGPLLNSDIWVAKLTNSGVIEWEHKIGAPDEAYVGNISQTIDGGYVVCGEVGYSQLQLGPDTGDAFIAKLSNSGTLLWTKTFGGSKTDSANCIQQTTDGGYIVACSTISVNGDIVASHGDFDAWILKLEADPLQTTAFEAQNIRMYPNPTTGVVNFDAKNTITAIVIFDNLGRKVKQFETVFNNTITITDLDNGVYFIHLSTENGTETIKIILNK